MENVKSRNPCFTGKLSAIYKKMTEYKKICIRRNPCFTGKLSAM